MKEQRKEALQIIDKQRELRQQVLADIGEAAKKLIDCSEEKENVDKAAVEALHQAEKGLRNLSIIMRQAANFWKYMEVSILTGVNLLLNIVSPIIYVSLM